MRAPSLGSSPHFLLPKRIMATAITFVTGELASWVTECSTIKYLELVNNYSFNKQLGEWFDNSWARVVLGSS